MTSQSAPIGARWATPTGARHRPAAPTHPLPHRRRNLNARPAGPAAGVGERRRTLPDTAGRIGRTP